MFIVESLLKTFMLTNIICTDGDHPLVNLKPLFSHADHDGDR